MDGAKLPVGKELAAGRNTGLIVRVIGTRGVIVNLDGVTPIAVSASLGEPEKERAIRQEMALSAKSPVRPCSLHKHLTHQFFALVGADGLQARAHGLQLVRPADLGGEPIAYRLPFRFGGRAGVQCGQVGILHQE